MHRCDPDSSQPGHPAELLFELIVRETNPTQLSSAIAKLPAKEKVILALLYFEELTVPDVAAILGVGVASVEASRKRAVQMLKRLLNAAEESIYPGVEVCSALY